MECRKKTRTEKQKETRRREWSRPATSSKVFCLRCRADGHIAPNCLLREDKKSGHNKERRVDSCVVEASTGKLTHLGESFPFCFDSGAECSLIKESAASKFSGKRTTDVVVMRGIGNTCVKSTSQILSTVCINGFTLEIAFHVLPDKYLKYDIMIGREILSQGFDVHITRTSLDICKTKVVNVCDRTVEKEIDLNEVDTVEGKYSLNRSQVRPQTGTCVSHCDVEPPIARFRTKNNSQSCRGSLPISLLTVSHHPIGSAPASSGLKSGSENFSSSTPSFFVSV